MGSVVYKAAVHDAEMNLIDRDPETLDEIRDG